MDVFWHMYSESVLAGKGIFYFFGAPWEENTTAMTCGLLGVDVPFPRASSQLSRSRPPHVSSPKVCPPTQGGHLIKLRVHLVGIFVSPKLGYPQELEPLMDGSSVLIF